MMTPQEYDAAAVYNAIKVSLSYCVNCTVSLFLLDMHSSPRVCTLVLFILVVRV